MRYVLFALISVLVFACGPSFFLGQQPVEQRVMLIKGERMLDLKAESLLQDNEIRIRLYSEFYQGSAQILYSNDNFNFEYTRLPLDKKDVEDVKGDMYAAFFAGDFPFRSDSSMFGKTEIRNNIKYVYDTDGYHIYKVYYTENTITLENIIREYSIKLESPKPFAKPAKSN